MFCQLWLMAVISVFSFKEMLYRVCIEILNYFIYGVSIISLLYLTIKILFMLHFSFTVWIISQANWEEVDSRSVFRSNVSPLFPYFVNYLLYQVLAMDFSFKIQAHSVLLIPVQYSYFFRLILMFLNLLLQSYNKYEDTEIYLSLFAYKQRKLYINKL